MLQSYVVVSYSTRVNIGMLIPMAMAEADGPEQINRTIDGFLEKPRFEFTYTLLLEAF